jgi:predicted AAA+ superfamily ATPase
MVTQLLSQLPVLNLYDSADAISATNVGAHLINYSISERYHLYYWRDGNYEVDFVLEKGNKVIGLEVKSGMKADNAGMSIFAGRFHPEKVLLVGTGGIPYDEFLKINPKKLF